ncbi:flagellar assembly protein FliH [Pseudomonas sp. C27(2019)]|nr:flagellar assembly protein FliH [Pseudomonas sp. C27(2019)]
MTDKKPSSELLSAQQSEAFSLWDLPSFDQPSEELAVEPGVTEGDAAVEDSVRVEEVTIEDVKPLTLDEVEAIRQDAWNEGFSTGEKDGFHAGQLKAAQEAEVALASKVQTLENIMRELFEPIANQDQQLEEAMLELVLQISQQVIQRELKIDSSQIKQVVRESLKLLPIGSEAVRVYINPQDFEQIKALRERHEESWKIIEDDELLPGGCRFESVNTQINASIETRIEHIATQILEQQRELKSQPLEPDLQVDLEAVDSTLEQPVETVEATEVLDEPVAQSSLAEQQVAADHQQALSEQSQVAEPKPIHADTLDSDADMPDSAADKEPAIDDAPPVN